MELHVVPGDMPELEQPRDRCTLTMLVGSTPGRVFVIDGDAFVFGRGTDADVQLQDAGLSRKHARIYRDGSAWFVEDLGSTNGTFVGRRRLKRPQTLHHGDRIQLAEGVLFSVAFQDAMEQAAARQMYESAVRDPLTRVYNRRYLDERLEGEFAYATRHIVSLSVLLLDIDHFKRINDTLGHQAGDAVIRVVAGMVQRMVRAEDVVARYGGEEFAVIARGIGHRNAQILGERIRKLVQGLAIPWEGRSVHVTVSIGVATWTQKQPYETLAQLISAADVNLYRAKETGRDRVCG